jgi:LmbE family N-acetylglucosaminyl deacetylase
MEKLAFRLLIAGIICGSRVHAQDVINPWPADPYEANNRLPDERYKADLLVVVAHPDDEIMAAAYIAREIDQGKRVAIVWTTLGDGGVNEVGPEQAAAMGDIREVEGMRAAASLGITNMWNLGGPDTPSQNPLVSLETCNHARCLGRLVRIVRLTRPAVILTWLPLGVTGENHGDHQASGVLATEAFDMAGDPTEFPEQVTPASEPRQNTNHLEGLRPWQPQKIYYFSNPTHMDFFTGQGPQYAATDISPRRHVTYGQIAAEEFIYHRTQGGGKVEQALLQNGAKGLEHPIPLMKPSQFILGKSLEKAATTDDVFAGIVTQGIRYHRAPGFTPVPEIAPVMKLGGAWNFYRQFWQAHGLDHLAALIPAELSIEAGGTLSIPLLIENPTADRLSVKLAVQYPAGWKLVNPAPSASIDRQTTYFLRVQATAPKTKLAGWQEFSIDADSSGKSLGRVTLRVEMANWALPQ